MGGVYNGWTIEEGGAWAKTVRWPGVSDATGWLARMDIRQAREKTSSLILALTIANGRIGLSSGGGYLVISLSVPASATKNLPFNGVGHFDLELIPPSGEDDAFRALQGTIAYSKEVTAG